MDVTKQQIVDALRAFVSQRSGIDSRNYFQTWRDTDGIKAMRSDQHKIRRDGADARVLLSFVEGREWITADALRKYLTSGGRLFWDGPSNSPDYHVGQYYPTEYRAAVCRFLAQIIWSSCRAHGIDDVRKYAREQFGRGLQGRWFN